MRRASEAFSASLRLSHFGQTAWPSIHRGVGGDQAELLHALEALAAQRVVAVLVARLVLGDVGVVRVQRPVRRGEGQVGEEGLARVLAALDVIDQLVVKKSDE
jgi:hypothetical protein